MRVFDLGARPGPEQVSGRVLTLPNLLSVVRIAALPWVFLDIVGGAHLRALVVLGVVAATDWVDGYVARRFGQVSRLGKLLDPVSDRLLVATVGVALILGEVVPAWVVLVLIARDVLMLLGGAVLLLRGISPPAVTRVGKTATFGLMVALPCFLLAEVLGGDARPPARLAAWVLYAIHTPLYYAAGIGYLRAIRRRGPATAAAPARPAGEVR